MEPLRVVVHIYERCDISAQIFNPAIFVGADFFALESLHETLAFRVIPRIREPTHACDDLIFVQHFAVLARRLLDSAIGVVYEPRHGRSTTYRVL